MRTLIGPLLIVATALLPATAFATPTSSSYGSLASRSAASASGRNASTASTKFAKDPVKIERDGIQVRKWTGQNGNWSTKGETWHQPRGVSQSFYTAHNGVTGETRKTETIRRPGVGSLVVHKTYERGETHKVKDVTVHSKKPGKQTDSQMDVRVKDARFEQRKPAPSFPKAK